MFLKNYLAISNFDVIYGGRKTPNKTKKSNEKLRWKYGLKVEDQSFDYRLNNPYLSFRSNNFLIKKSVFKIIKFDESFISYGHEDTLLALELQKRNIKIHQIDNSVYHDGIEENTEFLLKLELQLKISQKLNQKNITLTPLN